METPPKFITSSPSGLGGEPGNRRIAPAGTGGGAGAQKGRRCGRELLESRVEEWLKTQIAKRGGLYLKFSSPGNIGVPDRIIIRNGEVVFVELKQEHGVLSEIQKAQIDRMRSHGAKVLVVYGKAGAEDLVETLFPQPKSQTRRDGFGIEEWR